MIVNKSKYQYIVSSVILDNYRHKGYGKEMMKELLKSEKKVLCALTITKDGYNLAKKFMKLKLKINDDTNVFVLNRWGYYGKFFCWKTNIRRFKIIWYRWTEPLFYRALLKISSPVK